MEIPSSCSFLIGLVTHQSWLPDTLAGLLGITHFLLKNCSDDDRRSQHSRIPRIAFAVIYPNVGFDLGK
jgi:hypothetical protein